MLNLLIFKQSKDKKQMSDLENCLSTIKITDSSGYEFCSFKVLKYSMYCIDGFIYQTL